MPKRPRSRSWITARTPASGADEISELHRVRSENVVLREQVAQLHRAKLAGDILVGVAHDLGTALTGLVWCCEALQKRVQDDPDLATGLVDFVGAAEYSRSLAQRLVDFGKPRAAPMERLELTQTVRDSLELVEMLRPGRLTVVHDLGQEEFFVWANRTQIQQVLLNLAANSFHAMVDQGTTVTFRVTAEHSPIAQGGPEGVVKLSVEDNGPGMPRAVAERAFEPFFSTKVPSTGAGLGLAVVHLIIESCGGTVELTSEPDAGTRVDIQLPVHTAVLAPRSAGSAES